ncbi:hypothetical protein FALBO_6577 [Fusarium albosuccineum]|uniref:Cyanovirin-N domain-containing protein n=1 Tax=Fusarium albosuccineum TaxID=1237068 RepID=A0A8H4PEH9_9HYPO|nr:hypothetical protein FALBO_6577 [Fusarium albosuccineum]
MKNLLAICLLASKAFASILPGNAAIVARNEEGIGEVAELEVTNDLFPGKVFKGTAESIYAEMNALNPDGLAQQNAELERRDNLALSNDDGDSKGLERRQGTFKCSWGHEILNWMKCFDALAHLQNLGTSMCMVGGGHGTIVRVACSRGCSMYLSNKLNHQLGVHCRDIAKDIGEIYMNCASASGQRFHGARDFNSHYIGLGEAGC